MKIIIVGYGEMFRSLIMGILKTRNEIVGVFRQENVTLPKYKKAVYDILKPSTDYNFIKTHKLYEIKANSVNSKEFIAEVKRLQADVIITGSWGEKFSAQTINSPKIACINAHPSLLPKYRGPNPYLQTIIHNEKQTGITFHIMDINYDTGSVLHQKEVQILDNDTGETLKGKCCDTAKKEVVVLLNNLKEKLKNQQSQNEKEATYQHHISLGDTIIDFREETSNDIDRRIRALTPWYKCHIKYKNDFYTFEDYKICTEKTDKEPATILKKTNKAIFIACKDGGIMKFSKLKIELKQPLSNLLSKYYFNKLIKVNEKAV